MVTTHRIPAGMEPRRTERAHGGGARAAGEFPSRPKASTLVLTEPAVTAVVAARIAVVALGVGGAAARRRRWRRETTATRIAAARALTDTGAPSGRWCNTSSKAPDAAPMLPRCVRPAARHGPRPPTPRTGRATYDAAATHTPEPTGGDGVVGHAQHAPHVLPPTRGSITVAATVDRRSRRGDLVSITRLIPTPSLRARSNDDDEKAGEDPTEQPQHGDLLPAIAGRQIIRPLGFLRQPRPGRLA